MQKAMLLNAVPQLRQFAALNRGTQVTFYESCGRANKTELTAAADLDGEIVDDSLAASCFRGDPDCVA